MKKGDINAILERAKKENTKTRRNLYFDDVVFEEFQKDCKKRGVSVSRALEEFMKEVCGLAEP